MKQSSLPTLFSTPFGADAASGNITQPIPPTTSASGRASLQNGFPGTAFQSISAGGTFPYGQDVNGILYMLSAAAQAQQAGVLPPFNSTFASDIGGYAKNAIVADANTTGLFWVSTADSNTSTPGQSGATWIPVGGTGTASSNGYRIYPPDQSGNQWIEQWGSNVTNSGGNLTIELPIAFPNALVGCSAQEDNAASLWGDGTYANFMGTSKNTNAPLTSFIVYGTSIKVNSSLQITQFGGTQITFGWRAWGY